MTRKRIVAALRHAGHYLVEGLAHTARMTYPADPRAFFPDHQAQPELPPPQPDLPARPDRLGASPRSAMRAYRVDEYLIWLEDGGDGR